MFKKSILLSALCATSIGMSGCSTMWSMASEFSADMAEVTKFSFLRGSSDKSDVSFAENAVDAEAGVYKTDVGEYVPTETYAETEITTGDFISTDFAPVSTESFADVLDTSPIPCPDGTYLTAEETCMSLDVDTYDFSELDAETATQVVDTSQHDCPEDTYLNDKNQCMFFETETFDFEDDVNFTQQTVDTSPLPCPEDTYLTAEGACQFLNDEPVDFALNTDAAIVDAGLEMADATTAATILPAASIAPSNAVAANLSVQCPEGFEANALNSCMFVGSEPK